MLSVSLPQAPIHEELGENAGRFVIKGCYPGFGTTLGNSMRRVLLSSLPGNAAVSVKIKGITHEFATIDGVMEDAVQIILNLKKVRFKLHGAQEATIFLNVKGEKEVTAADFKTTSEIEVVNKDQIIATTTSASAELELEVKVQKGLGYVPVEQQDREEKEIGSIAIDAVYTPIRRVNFVVDNMRVGKRTDFDKITLEIITDGSITPQEAYAQAAEILLEQVTSIANLGEEVEEAKVEENPKEEGGVKKEEKSEGKKLEETPITELGISTRTMNVLEAAEFVTVGQIADKKEEEILELEGMGDKGVKEIKKAIGTLGITLKS
jgi:DNA-directed RNA polymerase subunit alpha